VDDLRTAARERLRPRYTPRERLAAGVAGLMMLGLSAVGICYAIRQPGLDPITIWPFAFWGLGAAALGIILAPLLRLRLTVLVVGYGLLTTVVISEEPAFLWRSLVHRAAGRARGRNPAPALRVVTAPALRVVTVNCAGGREDAILDALAQDPDIVLLQEGPGEAALERIAPESWECAGWMDPAIMVRGTLIAERLEKHLAHCTSCTTGSRFPTPSVGARP